MNRRRSVEARAALAHLNRAPRQPAQAFTDPKRSRQGSASKNGAPHSSVERKTQFRFCLLLPAERAFKFSSRKDPRTAEPWELQVERDVIVIGSGAGAMTAAVVAAQNGLDVLVLEKAVHFGGTSALSGGVAWIPNNPHVAETGEKDSRERALRYFESLVGKDRMRPEVMQAFIENGPRMVEFLEKNTEVQFERTTYPDYKSHLDGGMPVGRSISAREYDGRLLGRHFASLRPPMRELCVLGTMMVDGLDIQRFMTMTRSFASFKHAVRRFTRFAIDRVRHGRGTRLVMGNALMARLVKSALNVDVALWNETPARCLVKEGSRVVGVVVLREGKELLIRARHGVVIGSGGFSHDDELKRRLIPHPDQHETICPETNSGDGIRMALNAGAKLGGNTWHNFLGTQVTMMRGSDGRIVSKIPFLRRDRNKPGFVLVNREGRRFVSESWPYNDVAHAMNNAPGAVPSYLICDHVRLRKYGLGLVRPGPAWARPLGKYLSSGHLVRGSTLAELARKLGIHCAGLEETVRKNNEFARTGKDSDFGKGDTPYDRWQGDPMVKPNPSLGPIESGPYYAVTLWPGDLGTFCGLVTDGRARVLDENDVPIWGLYACGCDMHPVFSGSYPGGGGSIGPGMTFGFIAGGDIVDSARTIQGAAHRAAFRSTGEPQRPIFQGL
jgi:glycine/D-amino acid oxidase-like deaminating enzyme